MRNERGHFLPGESGNPGGKPRGFSALAREAAEAADVLKYHAEVAAGLTRADVKTRLLAGQWLVERGYGKAVAVTLNGDISPEASAGLIEVGELGPEDLQFLQRIQAKRLSEPEDAELVDVEQAELPAQTASVIEVTAPPADAAPDSHLPLPRPSLADRIRRAAEFEGST